uniref:Uncharacterized protein n=1 Tax=Ciona savignyi TaxID=51511 RepID=H2ZNC0_CIOSA
MKVTLARLVAMHIEQGLSPSEASKKALQHMHNRVSGSGGVIVLDARGRVGVHHTTNLMSWARIGGIDPDDVIKPDDVVEYGTNVTNPLKENI